MYLLAQFRGKRAYPLIVDFFSIPGELVLDVTGDVVTEDLNRILASVSWGDANPMKSLIENADVTEYVRAAALRGLLVLVARGEKTRDEIMTYYQHLFRGGIEREPSYVWAGLVRCCCDLYPEEVVEDIQQASQGGLVEEMSINYASVTRALALGKDMVLARLMGDSKRHRYIENTLAEIEWWACFNKPARPKVSNEKVGRNDPCPCGSGKKYKKCCGR